MQWIGDPVKGRGVCQRRFDVACEGRVVPGLVWTPESSPAEALVLLGHGGTLHKASPYILSLARRLVRHLGFAAAAIDGPIHGERRPDGGGDPVAVGPDFQKAWETPGVTDAMIADWRATLDALQALPEIGDVATGYWGISMGTIFGLPLVAAEPRVRAAVLGLMGDIGPSGRRMAEDAARVSVPVLFLAQWHDELVPRERVFALFEALAARDKRLHVHPGRHREVPAEEFLASERFLAQHLAGARDSGRVAAS